MYHQQIDAISGISNKENHESEFRRMDRVEVDPEVTKALKVDTGESRNDSIKSESKKEVREMPAESQANIFFIRCYCQQKRTHTTNATLVLE